MQIFKPKNNYVHLKNKNYFILVFILFYFILF